MTSNDYPSEYIETAYSVIRIKPQNYVHIIDHNSGVTRLEVGPKTVTLGEGEKLVLAPQPMIVIAPQSYAVINHPVLVGGDRQPVFDQHGQVELRYGEQEIRFTQAPFPLYPGEELVGTIHPLQVVERNQALRLRALWDFTEEIIVNGATENITRLAGDQWLFEGPATYIPRIEVAIMETIDAILIKPNQALSLQATQDCIDRHGNSRIAGEEWLVRQRGAYLPAVDEQVGKLVDAYILTEEKALQLKATRTFTDIFGRQRRAGDQWLVTVADAETHIPDVYEEVVGEISVTTLNDGEWCIVVNPIDTNGKPQLGLKEIRQGRRSFFLHPGEYLEPSITEIIDDLDEKLTRILQSPDEPITIRKSYMLQEQQALLLKAKENFQEIIDGDNITREAGQLWMIYGPREYIPRLELEVVEKRKAIPLDQNEGVYIRNLQTGELSLIRGPQAYMLAPYEVLWERKLPSIVEKILGAMATRFTEGRGNTAGEAVDLLEGKGPYYGHRYDAAKYREHNSQALVFNIPQNGAVQLQDFKNNQSRVVFGPNLVMLGPDEEVTVLSLSGGVPKVPHRIKSLILLLGPDFMTDTFPLETADHARLKLKLSYNWYFDLDRENQAEALKLFQVPDFVGTACKAIASRVRSSVAGVNFDAFHRNSAEIIRRSVFGVDEAGNINTELRFNTNNLVINNVDIQAAEPVDQETLASLQKSVQLAISITTNAQEAAARHDAERIEQEAKARLERQMIIDQAAAEAERRNLLEMSAENSAIEAVGQANAEARARTEASRIQGEASILLAQQETEASRIRSSAQMEILVAQHQAEIAHQQALDQLATEKARRTAEIETAEFRRKVEALGAETIRAIAQAGPEMQVRLLESLGLQSVLITDGKNPINLFGTANGLIAPMTNASETQGNHDQ
jgi:major vault protein